MVRHPLLQANRRTVLAHLLTFSPPFLAFQTAVALADFEGAKDEEGKILLKDTHIMQIVRMSKEFKTYLHELHQGDESKRAERQRMRYDDYEAQSGDSDGRTRKI